MVFVSLEGFLEASVPTEKLHAHAVPVPHAIQLPQAPVHVVVTPGSPSTASASNSGQKRSRLRRATSAFSSLSSKTTKHDQSPTDVATGVAAPPTADGDFVVYVTDRDVHHKWVLTKTQAEYAALKFFLQTSVAGFKPCRSFACCGPLRRIVASSQYKKPKRRWSESRVVTQFGRCSVVQEFLNDLLLAVLRRDAECDATRLAWDAVSAFLDVQIQRSDVADKIVLLRTMGGDGSHPEEEEEATRHHFRRSVSEQLPTRCRTRTGSSTIMADQNETIHKCAHATVDSDTESSQPGDEDEETDTECPICCAGLDHQDGELKTAKLLCGHAFHAECVRVWLRMQHTCPVCRIPIEGM